MATGAVDDDVGARAAAAEEVAAAARDLAATYDVDTNAVKPWFELQRVLHDGIFFAASQLYGVSFRERDDLPAYAEDVRTRAFPRPEHTYGIAPEELHRLQDGLAQQQHA